MFAKGHKGHVERHIKERNQHLAETEEFTTSTWSMPAAVCVCGGKDNGYGTYKWWLWIPSNLKKDNLCLCVLDSHLFVSMETHQGVST